MDILYTSVGRLEFFYSTCNAVFNSCKAFRILLNHLMKSKTAISYRLLSGGLELLKNTIVKDTMVGKTYTFLSLNKGASARLAAYGGEGSRASRWALELDVAISAIWLSTSLNSISSLDDKKSSNHERVTALYIEILVFNYV